jgi:hypothetical protein
MDIRIFYTIVMIDKKRIVDILAQIYYLRPFEKCFAANHFSAVMRCSVFTICKENVR